MANNIRKWVGVLTIAACCGWVLRVGLTQPDHSGFNWDVIGYVASMYKQDGLSGEPLRRAVFENVLKEVGESDLEKLTAGASRSQHGSSSAEQVPDATYRATVFNDPVSLEQQIPFYSIRVLYLQSIRIVDHFVHSYSSSSILVNAIYAALCVLIVALLLEHFRISQLYLPAIIYISKLTTIGRISSPDALACLLSLLALLLLVKRSRWVFVAIVALPLARTDFVILSLILCLFSFRLFPIRITLLSAALSVGLLVVDNHLNGNYGFLRVFNFTLFGVDPYPATMENSARLTDYVNAYISGAKRSHSQHLLVYMFSLVLFGMRFYRRNPLAEPDYIFIASMLFVSLHLILFPLYLERFFVFPVIVSLIFMINRMAEGAGLAAGRLRHA
ncbi:hypothetical protein AB4Y35_10965 [Paraburkholderia sp. EG286A]|uniref:hypothetical protein n=1 Tax=Paraburkholderia sp. EG286A TaxID=3237014 RepID=UPI0034D27C93